MIEKAKEKLKEGKLVLVPEIVRFNPKWLGDKELEYLPSDYELNIDGVKWIVDHGINKPDITRSHIEFVKPEKKKIEAPKKEAKKPKSKPVKKEDNKEKGD